MLSAWDMKLCFTTERSWRAKKASIYKPLACIRTIL